MALDGTSNSVRTRGALVPVRAALQPWRDLPRERPRDRAVVLSVPETQPRPALGGSWRPAIPTTLIAAQLLATHAARGAPMHTAQVAARYRSADQLAFDKTSSVRAQV